MLKTLRIRNLVTIEDLSVEFGPGLNVLTGETGAGKSIVVDALGLASGERGDNSLVRAGEERSIIEAAFDAPAPGPLADLLAERGLDAGEVIVVRRELSAAGAGRVVVNGSPTTVGVLRELGAELVELHGQNEQQGLLSPERHVALLDAFGGSEKARMEVAASHRRLIEAQGELARIEAAGRQGEDRGRVLRETVREIRAAAPRAGELAALSRDRAVLANGARVAELLDEAIGRLEGGESPATGALHAAARRVAELSRIDPELSDLAARIETARLEIDDARDTLVAYRDRADFDPQRLESIESRRVALTRLLLKWGPAEDDALAAADEAERELATIDNLDAALQTAHDAVAAAKAAYHTTSRVLSALRAKAAFGLGHAVEAELTPLAFSSARFSVVLTSRTAPHPEGAERAEFFLAANPGEPARPLAKAASGGELSRLMLALHVVLDTAEPGRVLVFDEVDAGVSGSVAVAVGARLARLASRHQVLCVTHLPQVAAHADGHFHVGKRVASGRTHTAIVPLSGDARIDELARMLGGRKPTGAARENAAELIAEAGAGRTRGRM